MTLFFLIIAVCILGFGAARYAAGRFADAMELGKRSQAPENKTGADIAAEFLVSNEAADVQILRHNAVVSDYFDPARRRLFLRSDTHDGKHLAAWALALHEAGHALQTGEERETLRWRQSCITMTRYIPVAVGILALAAMVFRRIQGRYALLVFMGACALVLALNIGTLAIEFASNKLVMHWLEERLRRYPGALNKLQSLLGGIATREVGDLLDSPRYFFFSALPGTGKKRPTVTKSDKPDGE